MESLLCQFPAVSCPGKPAVCPVQAGQGNSATRAVQVCPAKPTPIPGAPSNRPLAIALAEFRFSLPTIPELSGLEKIFASVSPDTVNALQEKIAVLMDFDDPDRAERQAIVMSKAMDDVMGASSLIVIYEVVNRLRASARLTSGKIDTLVSRLQSLDMLYQEWVPDKIVSTLEVHDALGVVVHPYASAKRATDSVMGVPGIILASLFHPFILGEGIEDKISGPISKQFGHNLNQLLTFLPPKRIEIGAGRGLLSAVLNTCVDESGIGNKMFFTSDKSPISKPWPGIDKVLKLPAEKIIEKYRRSPLKEKIIYLCTSPDVEMIKAIIATNEPVLLLVVSELCGIKAVSLGVLAMNDDMSQLGLIIEPSKVGGGVLLGLNMESEAFAAIADGIPDRYKLFIQ